MLDASMFAIWCNTEFKLYFLENDIAIYYAVLLSRPKCVMFIQQQPRTSIAYRRSWKLLKRSLLYSIDIVLAYGRWGGLPCELRDINPPQTDIWKAAYRKQTQTHRNKNTQISIRFVFVFVFDDFICCCLWFEYQCKISTWFGIVSTGVLLFRK